MIIIESKRRKAENILKKYPRAILADVTSQAKDGLVKLSPFYPHGGIPVPFSPGWTATCVEAVWQGLKVFEHADVDVKLFRNDTMKVLKRTVRQFGKPLGHRRGTKRDLCTDVPMDIGTQGTEHHSTAQGGKTHTDHSAT